MKVISPQLILKALPKLFEAKQEPVRDGAKNVTVSQQACPIQLASQLCVKSPTDCQLISLRVQVELCCYTGPKLIQDTLLEKMPESMRKDVEKSLQDIPPGRKRPERYTRKEGIIVAAETAEPGPATSTAGPASKAVAAHVDEACQIDRYCIKALTSTMSQTCAYAQHMQLQAYLVA